MGWRSTCGHFCKSQFALKLLEPENMESTVPWIEKKNLQTLLAQIPAYYINFQIHLNLPFVIAERFQRHEMFSTVDFEV